VSDIAIHRPIAQVVGLPALDHASRLALAAPFLISGVVRLLDFPGPKGEVEWFFVKCYAEHLRQHWDVLKADADIQAEARHFHQGLDDPVVPHSLPLDPRRAETSLTGEHAS
jgi:hypothetical protein